MARERDDRHRYGQHYTPTQVARLLAALAIRASCDVVFDPSCGDGRLLDEAIRRKRELSTRPRARSYAQDVYGMDRSESAALLARETGARTICADFFDVEPGAVFEETVPLPNHFDAVIGNPPYIRQEVMGARDKLRVERCLERDRARLADIFWPRWSRRSDMYVYFFAHSTGFLKERGRLVFLTAASWLDVDYGAALRQFLSENFRIIAVIESAAESFFEDASINTAITVIEREPVVARRESNQVRFVQLLRPLEEVYSCYRDAPEFARAVDSAARSISTSTHRMRAIRQSELLASCDDRSGWGKYLRADDVFFQIVGRGSARLKRLSDMASVRFGVKTGANDFFYLDGTAQNGSGVMKRLGDVATVRRGLTTGANDFFYLNTVDGRDRGSTLDQPVSVEDRTGALHQIEARFLSPVIFSLKEISGVVIERGQTRKLLFDCAASPEEMAGTRALDYIKSGERAGYHLRPTCAARQRWYSAARGMKPAPLIFPSKVGERWLVALNRASVFEDKKLYGVFPQKGVRPLLLAALLNSTWARYYAEITCRQMTGAQAIADIDVSVAERILLPDPRGLTHTLKKKLEAALKEIARRPVISVFEEVKRDDRRNLDGLVLEAIGFDDASELDSVIGDLYSAVTEIVRRRLARSAR